MRTTNPISTISFNTEDYLKLKLSEFHKGGRISFWSFIKHLPEPDGDEAGKKEHFHVFIEPSKMLQTEDLRLSLREFDPAKPDKPKGCLTFHSSKFSHWYLYGLHDRRYLSLKGLSRRLFYSRFDFVSSDSDDFVFRVESINHLEVSPFWDMLEAIQDGVTWSQYFARGTIPIQQIRQYEYAWATLCGLLYPDVEGPEPPLNLKVETQTLLEASGLACKPGAGD